MTPSPLRLAAAAEGGGVPCTPGLTYSYCSHLLHMASMLHRMATPASTDFWPARCIAEGWTSRTSAHLVQQQQGMHEFNAWILSACTAQA